MLQRALIEFRYPESIAVNIDRRETAASYLLKPLRLAFGKVVLFTPGRSSPFTELPQVSVVKRIFAAMIAILFFPITLIGIGSVYRSKTHELAYTAYTDLQNMGTLGKLFCRSLMTH